MSWILRSFKNFLKKILSNCLPPKYIIFESAPDLSDNTKEVFDEMVRRKLYQKYTFVWLVSDSKKAFPRYPNTVFVDYTNNSRKFMYYKLRAKCLIFCNSFIEKANTATKSFYLTHATQIKDSRAYYRAPDDIDYCFVTAQAFEISMANVYGVDLNKMVAFGFPRNDILFEADLDLNNIFHRNYKKFIVWYPTFRQSKGGRVVEGCECLPLIHNQKQAELINQFLVERDVLVILKPHFAQDIKYIKDLHLSNIVFIEDSFFIEKKITSYQLVGSCDALLTDYSSIYFDYLACNKPIGVVWEDIEFYKKNRGFCLDIDYYLKGAEKIYNVEDFFVFIDHILNDNDILRRERLEIRELAHDYIDGNNTKRVVDFIIEEASL